MQLKESQKNQQSRYKNLLLMTCMACAFSQYTNSAVAQDQTGNTDGVPVVGLDNTDPDFQTNGNITSNGDNAPAIGADGFTGTITVSAGNQLIINGNDPDATAQFNPSGISAQNSNQVTINHLGQISTNGSSNVGIEANNIADVTISSSGNITTNGNSAIGINIDQSAGNITNDGNITTTGSNSTGIDSSFLTGATFITNGMNGNISADGFGSSAIRANSSAGLEIRNQGTLNTSNGAQGVTINDSDGILFHNEQNAEINTTGDVSFGIQLSASADATLINDGTISTTGSTSLGIVTFNINSGSITNSATGVIRTTGNGATAVLTSPGGFDNITNAGLIETQGDAAHGVTSQVNIDGAINNTDGALISTSGAGSHGIQTFSVSGAALSVNNDGTVRTQGADSIGVEVTSTTTSIVNNSTDAEITSDLGDAITFISSANVTNTLINDGSISGGNMAINGADSIENVDNRGSISGNIDLAGGDDILSNSGSITGDIGLGDGDDSFEYVAGSSQGNVDGGAGADIATFTITATDAAETVDSTVFTNIETADHSAGGSLTLNADIGFNTVIVGVDSELTLANANASNVTTTLDAGSSLTVDSVSTISNTNANGVAVQAIGDGVTIDNQGSVEATGANGTAISLSGGSNTISNSGTISGTGLSINGGGGADIIDNSGTITGDAQLGAGDDRVTLTANAVFNGAIDFGDGNDTLVVDVADGDTKNIDRVAFDPFNNLETFEKTGAGSVFIDAGVTATATDSFIRAGLFQVDGIYNSNVFIDAAAALQGTGQIGGDATISGVYSAGVGLGQFTVDGDLTLDGTSVFVVDLNFDDADLTFVGGAATFQDGILVVMPDGEVVSADGMPFRHEVVRTNDGVTQSFSDIDTGGIGRALVFVEGDSLFIEIIPQTGDGEVYTAAPAIHTTSALTVIDALNGQLVDRRGVENGRVDLWVTSLNDFARYHGNVQTDTSNYHVDVHGVMAGFGYGLTDNLTLGAFAGYQNLDQDFTDILSSTDGDNVFFGLYTIGDYGRFNFNGALSYHASDLRASRAIPALGTTAFGSYDTDVFTVHGRVGYEILSTDQWFIEPYAGLAYIAADRQTFEERGAEAGNLEIRGGTTDFAYLDLGTRIVGGLFGGSLIPHISAGWRYDLIGENNAVTQRFVNGGDFFTTPGADLERSRLTASAGLLAYLSESFSIYATYDGEFGNALTSHGFRAGISYKF